MAFPSRRVITQPRGALGWSVAAGRGVCGILLRVALSVVVIAVVSVGLLYARLLQGPIELPSLNNLLIAQLNAHSSGSSVQSRTMVLELGDGRTPAGLEFHDVEVADDAGKPMFAVPRIRTSLKIADLLRGDVRPMRISVLDVHAQFIRMSDGRIRFGLGDGDGVALDSGDSVPSSEAMDAIAQIVDGFVGDADSVPELTDLRRIEILGAHLQYVDYRDGGSWSARGADLRISRDAGGARAVLEIDDRGRQAPGPALYVVADRRKGADQTTLNARFGRIVMADLANDLAAFGWARMLDTALEGEIAGGIGHDGMLREISGVVFADGGEIIAPDGVHPFKLAALRFRVDPGTGLTEFSDGLVSAPGLEARLSGRASLSKNGDGALSGVLAQIDLEQLHLNARDTFARTIHFDEGQIVGQWDAATGAVTIADSWMRRDRLILQANAHLVPGQQGLTGGVRASINALTVRQLLTYWPKNVAASARTWVAENISAANISDLVAQIKLDAESPFVALDADFTDLDGRYLPEMSPIRNASGDLHLSMNDFYLALDGGTVQPLDDAPIALAGSNMVIASLQADLPTSDIHVRATGSTAGLLELIDQKPLNLIGNLGLQLNNVSGGADVTALLNFPMANLLRTKDVGIDVDARLSSTGLELNLGNDIPIGVEADVLVLTADDRRLQLSGDAKLNGRAVNLDWREDYGGDVGNRQITLAGKMTAKALQGAGVAVPDFAGTARVLVDLTQVGAEPMQFDVDANLRNAGLEVSPLGWRKPPGRSGKLMAHGTIGKSVVIDRLTLDSASLSAEGAIEVGPDGDVRRANFGRVEMPEQLDAQVVVVTSQDGVPEVRLTGALLDISGRFGDGETERNLDASDEKPPFRMKMDVEELRISKKISVLDAVGSVEQTPGGALLAEIDGKLGTSSPVSIRVTAPGEGQTSIAVTSPDAGAALRDTDFYSDARGGKLFLDANVAETGLITGQVRIEDVVVRSESTFRNVLRDGGLEGAGTTVSSSGLEFRKIWIPFRYQDDIVEVTDAVAVSPALGLKMTGTVDERTELVDLVGVLSPAYGLTGALNDVPLIGQLLSGGEGEGVLGMTFTLKGAIDDPSFSVNPLSLLAPGFLRKVFTGGDANQDEAERLNERFQRQDQ